MVNNKIRRYKAAIAFIGMISGFFIAGIATASQNLLWVLISDAFAFASVYIFAHFLDAEKFLYDTSE